MLNCLQIANFTCFQGRIMYHNEKLCQKDLKFSPSN